MACAKQSSCNLTQLHTDLLISHWMDEEICDLKTKESKTSLRFPEFLVNFSIGNHSKILTPLWKRHRDIAIPGIVQFVQKQVPRLLVFEPDEGYPL